MALSNIFREPRREITESAVGIGVAVLIGAPVLWADYQLALAAKPEDFWVVLLFLGPFGTLGAACTIFGVGAAIFGVIRATHALGEAVCNALAKRGAELRPPRVAREPRSGDRCVWVRESENSVKLRPQL